MVERTRGLDIACHGLLILGGLLVCLPIYFAFVVGSHTVGDVLSVPPPWLPGGRFLENAATAWQKAQAVELWVNRNMKATEFSQAMATCSNVARTLSGDCTEYAMLAAGMCRALGIPSRTALGLVYAPGRDGKEFKMMELTYTKK